MLRGLRLLIGLPVVLVAGLTAQEPTVQVRLTGDDSPHLVVALRDLIADGRFLGAMESGFPMYVEFRVQLRESKPWWDRDVGDGQIWEYVILYDPVRERYVLEDARGSEIFPNRELLDQRLAQEYEIVLTPDAAGSFYYKAEVDVRTLEGSDVDEVFAWLKGEDVENRRPERPGAVTRVARQLLVAVAPLPRLHVEAQTPVFRRP